MINQEIAKIFREMALYFQMEEVPFKPFAYQKAAFNIETLSKDLREVYKKGKIKALENIPGVGKGLAEKIEEYIKTGRIKEYQEFRKKYPVEIEELTAIEGVGPKVVKILYQKLNIKNIKDLEKAAKEGKLRNLYGFGEKTEKNIIESIEFLKKSKGRFLLGEILPTVYQVIDQLKKLKEVKMISEAGSIRRKKETIGDVDILVVASDPEKVMDYFVNLKGVVKIWGKGKTKSSIRVKDGFDIDLRVVDEESFGSALQYFTGSKEHNIVLREIAIKKGFKLNEYGLFKKKKGRWEKVAGKKENEIYQILGLDFIAPELRENRGEIEAAFDHFLPKLVSLDDILGDLHIHSNWDGGSDSIEKLAEEGIKRGYQYIGISDHTKYLKIEHGLDEKKIKQRNKEIDKINQKFKELKIDFLILKGCEANILNDGSIDLDERTLKELDFVIAGIHSSFKMGKKEMTERMIKAMKNQNVDIISHPTGRLLMKRPMYEIDLDKIFKAAKETKTILEINSAIDRLDLNDLNIKKAKEMGIKMVINTDAHSKEALDLMIFGVFQARRGWAEKKDIINCHSVEKLKKMLK